MCLTRILPILVLLAALLSSPAAFSQSLREQYDQLTREYASDMAAWHARYDGADTNDDFIARYRDWPGWKYAPRFVKLAESGGAESAAFDSLSDVVEMGNSVSEADQELLPHYERSLHLLLRNHLDKELRPLCKVVGFTAGSETFLRTLVKQEKNRELRAEASFCLGRLLAKKRLAALPDSLVRRPGKTPFSKYINTRCRPGLLSYLEGSDEAAIFGEASKYLAIVCEEFGDVGDIRGKATLGELAKSELYELQHLSPGQRAPEIEGVDLLGKQMTLSEYRGKVVLLVFWASWCGPCMGDIPHEKELVQHFANRPFAIVGVNADDSLDTAAQVVRKHAIPWRSFWNGKEGRQGTIAAAWNVRGWPTVYVLDHLGIIKHKDLRQEDLDEPLEKMVTAAESPRRIP